MLDPGEKPVVPADHTESKGGALHTPDSGDPFPGGGNCIDYKCHHANLEGGWALVERADGEIQQTTAPSCFQCHGVLWNVRYPETIRILYPIPNAVWEQGASRPIEWWAPPARAFSVDLVQADTLVGSILESGRSDGVLRVDPIRASWGTGGGFRIQVTDEAGHSALSPSFSICEPGSGVVVTRPSEGTVFERGGSIEVEWYCAAGVTVDIFVFQHGDSIDVFRASAGNSGFESRQIPQRWGSGDGYQIMIRDPEGRSGSSEEFQLR